jgi:hypothetical protein
MYTLQQPDPNYVVNVLWELTGVDGVYTATLGGNTVFSSSQTSNFIPYDQLTNEIVIGWVQNALGADGVASYEATVQGQINAKMNPPVSPQITPLPWVN